MFHRGTRGAPPARDLRTLRVARGLYHPRAMEWTDVVTAARASLEITGLGADWITGRLPGSPRVLKLRQRLVNGAPWVQLLCAVGPATSARLFALLQDSALRVVGAPAIDERTLVLREALALRAATPAGVMQLAAVLDREAERVAARLVAPEDHPSDLATNFAE